MTERQSSDVIDMLRSRLGMRYEAGKDEGRREITRVIADECGCSGDEADEMTSRLIEAGMIRYVTGDERDPEGDPAALHDEHSDVARQGDATAAGLGGPLISAIPGAGGPTAATSGQLSGPVAPPAAGLGVGGPVAASGGGAGAPGSLAFAGPGADTGSRGGAGYWDFVGERAGVVPSSTRKGQVEPKGT